MQEPKMCWEKAQKYQCRRNDFMQKCAQSCSKICQYFANQGHCGKSADHGVKNKGYDCKFECGGKSGPCAYCGSGLCCRKGDQGNGSNGCPRNNADVAWTENFQSCIAPPPEE